MGWIISPSDGVENYDDGSFLLPCSESNVTYDVTYVSPEGCSSNTVSYTYVTSGECETPPPPVGTCPASGDVIDPYGARDSGAVWIPIMRVLKNDTYTDYTFTSSDEGKVGSIGLGSHTTGNWYLVNAQLSENTGDYRRTTDVTVHMTGTSTPSSGCDYTVGIVQEGSCAKLDELGYFGPMHNDYKVQGDGDSAIGASIVYVPTMAPFSSGAWTAAFASGTGNFVRNLTITNEGGGPGGTVKTTVDIDRNDTGAARTFDVIFTGTKTDGGICSKTVTITQDPYVPPTPTCDNFDLTSTTISYNSDGGSTQVGTMPSGSTVSAGTGTPSWITVKKGIGDPAPVSLTIQQNTSTDSRTGTVTFNVDEEECAGKTVTVSQSGSTGPQPWQKSFYYNISIQGTGGGTVNKTLAFKIGVLMYSSFVDEGPVFAQQTTNVTGLEGSWQERASSFKKVDAIQIEGDPTSDAKYITIKASEEGDTEPHNLLPKTEIPLNGGVRAGVVVFQTPYTFDKAMGTLYFYFDKT